MAKASNCIAINQMIWSDGEIRALSASAALRFIFLIAWSKAAQKDGRFTRYAVEICGGTQDDLDELLKATLVEPLPAPSQEYSIRTFGEWQKLSAEVVENASKAGKASAEKRWRPPAPTVVDGSFDIDQAAAASWALWPDAAEPKFREKRTEGIEAFKANITTAEDYLAFQAALLHRLQAYRSEQSHDRRRFLGAFKNFCTKWLDWVPKNYGVTAPPPPPAPAAEAVESEAPPVKDGWDSSKPFTGDPKDYPFLFKDE